MQLLQGDCLELMRALPDRSIDLIATDPPYYKVKGDAWDRQWDTPAAFLAWFDLIAEQWQRILRPNGSLYAFAWPKMAARVEVLLEQRFNILNSLVWRKEEGRHKAACKEDLRSFFPASERIILAEHKGADNIAKGEAGYAAKCDELRGFVFEPLRSYLAAERDRAGMPNPAINAAWCAWKGVASTSQTQKWFSPSCFNLPTAEAYAWLRDLFGAGSLPREYEDLRREYEDLRREYEDLRREYEDLRREYEDLRRPFTVTAEVPYTDVWTFPTVGARKGKHPCEKPAAMMEHIIRASSRPGAIVLDPFMGSGVTGEAAVRLGREFIGMEAGAEYFAGACTRIQAAVPTQAANGPTEIAPVALAA